jgi:hypothetical protein
MRLAALVQSHKKAVDAASYPLPAGEPSPDGMRCEWHWCERHQAEYLKTFLPKYGVWTGQCIECAADVELE